MTGPQFIGPLDGHTPAEPGVSQGRVRSLPYDLLKEASRRLEIMCILAVALWTVGTALDRFALVTMGGQMWRHWQATDAIAAVCVFASLALFFYIRRGDRDPRLILDLGQAYMVLTALALGLIIHWFPVWQNVPEIGQIVG